MLIARTQKTLLTHHYDQVNQNFILPGKQDKNIVFNSISQIVSLILPLSNYIDP